jgi:ketosteroid isomerase-like protein
LTREGDSINVEHQHPNIATYYRFSRAGQEDDVDVLHELLAEDVQWVVHGTSQIAGLYSGIEGVRRARARGRELTGNTILFEPEPLLANDSTVMFVARLRATRNGRQLDTHNSYLYRFANGKIVEAHTIPFDQALADDFWGSGAPA